MSGVQRRVAESFRQLREARGLAPKDFARLIGATCDDVEAMDRGEVPYNMTHLEALGQVLGLSFRDLIMVMWLGSLPEEASPHTHRFIYERQRASSVPRVLTLPEVAECLRQITRRASDVLTLLDNANEVLTSAIAVAQSAPSDLQSLRLLERNVGAWLAYAHHYELLAEEVLLLTGCGWTLDSGDVETPSGGLLGSLDGVAQEERDNRGGLRGP